MQPPGGGATGADDVDGLRTGGELDGCGTLHHRPDQAGHLIDGLPLHPQRHDERCDLGVGGLAPEDLAQRGPGGVSGEILTVHDGADQRRPPSVDLEFGTAGVRHRPSMSRFRRCGDAAGSSVDVRARWLHPTRRPSHARRGRTPGTTHGPDTAHTPLSPLQHRRRHRWVGRRSLRPGPDKQPSNATCGSWRGDSCGAASARGAGDCERVSISPQRRETQTEHRTPGIDP